jgi:hypothetical protein
MTITTTTITKDNEVSSIAEVKVKVTDAVQVEQKADKVWSLAEMDREISEAQAELAVIDTQAAAEVAEVQKRWDARKAALQARLAGYTATRATVLAEAEKVTLKEVVVEPKVEEPIK